MAGVRAARGGRPADRGEAPGDDQRARRRSRLRLGGQLIPSTSACPRLVTRSDRLLSLVLVLVRELPLIAGQLQAVFPAGDGADGPLSPSWDSLQGTFDMRQHLREAREPNGQLQRGPRDRRGDQGRRRPRAEAPGAPQPRRGGARRALGQLAQNGRATPEDLNAYVGYQIQQAHGASIAGLLAGDVNWADVAEEVLKTLSAEEQDEW